MFGKVYIIFRNSDIPNLHKVIGKVKGKAKFDIIYSAYFTKGTQNVDVLRRFKMVKTIKKLSPYLSVQRQ